MAAKYKYLCGVPHVHCQGGHLNTDQSFDTKKAHGSREQAWKCYAHYLVSVLGYTQEEGNTFSKPDHPRFMLGKKSKFGGKLRFGKEHTRWMPKGRGRKGGGLQGLII
ncbi:MAG: hypothetical protein ACXAEN_19270 [Candidatus Thorarchaeota archaeon]|jgi:hypothetical protein